MMKLWSWYSQCLMSMFTVNMKRVMAMTMMSDSFDDNHDDQGGKAYRETWLGG